MMPKITIAVDSFKGSLSSVEAAEALAKGVRSVSAEVELVTIPLADGGEGTAEVLVEALGGEWVEVATTDPLGRPMMARYGLCGTVAVVDVASAAGLTLLHPEERNPFKTSSQGVGVMVADALRRGARRVLLGVGGSATNDCGMGLLEGLGFRFRDSEGAIVRGCGESLGRVVEISSEGVVAELKDAKIEVLADVDSPLCGPLGAAYRFSPQKGATPDVVTTLDEGADSFAEVVFWATGRDMRHLKGAGAAGGIAGSLWALAGAEIVSGVERVLEAVAFEQRAEGSLLIVTGEGRVDGQTLTGKAPLGVLRRGQKMAIPVVAVGGSVEWSKELQGVGYEHIVAATPEDMPLEEALKPEVARSNLGRVGRLLAEEFVPKM